MNIREKRIYDEIHTLRKNIKTMTSHIRAVLSIPVVTMIIVSLGCGGCGGASKIVDADDTKEKVEKVILQKSDSSQSNTHPLQTTTPSVQATNFYPIAASNISDHTLEIPTDEFNVYKYLLSFYDKNTKTLLKKVDLVQDNPYHTKGLERRKEPFKNLTYFLSAPKAKNKYDVKQFLPQEFFNEIPEDFPIERAIASIYLSVTGTKYATVTYELDWLPDAYSDQGEWDGPGYGVHYVVVYDSLGNKIFNRQFDGTSHLPSVSMDGKYLFTMACLSPEWDKNIRYRFTVFNIKTGKTAYTELIENCQKNGGGGDIYPEFRFANGYYALIKNENVKGFSYENNKLFKYINDNKFTMFDISEEQLLLKYPNGREVIVKKDSLYQQIKID